jgi:hypothetical protein
MNFKQRYNTDTAFKQKVQRAAIFFALFVFGVSVFYAMNLKNSETDTQQEAEIQIDGNYVPTAA